MKTLKNYFQQKQLKFKKYNLHHISRQNLNIV